VAGRAPGAQLADLASSVADGVWVIAVQPPLASGASRHVVVEVEDQQGNRTRVERRFGVSPPPACGLLGIELALLALVVRCGRGFQSSGFAPRSSEAGLQAERRACQNDLTFIRAMASSS
jgi:hypothetical protein